MNVCGEPGSTRKITVNVFSLTVTAKGTKTLLCLPITAPLTTSLESMGCWGVSSRYVTFSCCRMVEWTSCAVTSGRQMSNCAMAGSWSKTSGSVCCCCACIVWSFTEATQVCVMWPVLALWESGFLFFYTGARVNWPVYIRNDFWSQLCFWLTHIYIWYCTIVVLLCTGPIIPIIYWQYCCCVFDQHVKGALLKAKLQIE